jgi:hypothetical protein
MRSEAWERKDLQTGLGSYVELKHDTVLYAKQSFAAEGDFDEVDFPEPRHWVEPNPVAFGRMAEVVGLLADGLTARGLLPADSDNAALLTALDDFLARLTDWHPTSWPDGPSRPRTTSGWGRSAR